MKPRGGSAPWWNSSMDPTPATPRSTSSKYKGVVPQPNGRWGAQIYENHQRLWLGTFDTEPAAARSYDMAAMRLRGTDADLNFKSEEDENSNNYDNGEEEDEFLSNAPKFQVKRRVPINEGANQENDRAEDGRRHKDDGLTREPMFEKPLTPSDVGKLNRLVIPKQYAERYFPINGESGEKGLQLSFEDEGGKIWRFRYSYWNSSQSYVLTKGWSRYVKEKKLDAGDIVSFHRREGKLYIRWRRRNAGDGFSGLGSGGGGQMQGSVPPSFGQWGPLFYSLRSAYPAHPPPAPAYVRGDQYDGLLHAGQPLAETSPAVNSKRLRLFGVNLDCPMDLTETITTNGPAHWTQSPAHATSLFYTGSSSHNP